MFPSSATRTDASAFSRRLLQRKLYARVYFGTQMLLWIVWGVIPAGKIAVFGIILICSSSSWGVLLKYSPSITDLCSSAFSLSRLRKPCSAGFSLKPWGWCVSLGRFSGCDKVYPSHSPFAGPRAPCVLKWELVGVTLSGSFQSHFSLWIERAP